MSRTTYMFSYLSPEQRVPAGPSLRGVRALTDEALQTMSRRFASLYATTGRRRSHGAMAARFTVAGALHGGRRRLLLEELTDNLLFPVVRG